MKKKSLGLWIVTTAVISGVVMLPVAVASEEEPEPARSEETHVVDNDTIEATGKSDAPTSDDGGPMLGSAKKPAAAATGSSEAASRPRTLADLASGIDLNSPKDGKSESIVINNQNLQKMGKGAVVSQGSNIGGSSGETDWFVPPSRRGPAPAEEDLESARREVEMLESQAQALNKAVEENKTANMYTGGGPQYRAPGVSDPLLDQQRNVNDQLADARSKLSDMESAAAAGARSGAGPGSSPSEPSQSDDSGE